MKYDLLLFDADDTLLDFKRSEDISFQIVLEKHSINGDVKAHHERYKTINRLLWDQHAEGLVTKDFLKVERFKRLLESAGLKGDPYLMSEDYQETLPSQVFLIDGAMNLLETLHKKIPMIIITNGIGHVQHKRLNNSGIKDFIDLMVISEECGYSKPDKRIFEYTLNLLKKSSESSRILMIGDKLETDIQGAANIGIDSCWFNPDNEKNLTSIKPTYEINTLLSLLEIL